jgi:uncharacterized membrane protein YqjE
MLNPDRPISAVLQDIVGNIQDIVRAEMRLAKSELTDELRKARAGAAWLGVGVLLLIFCALFLLLGAVYALTEVVPAWAAALIVGAGVGAIAAVCCGFGMKRFKSARGAPRTIATLKEDVEWAKRLTR